ncbi:MAG TPA: MFS transporter [Actinomycetota bacterium]|jgi:MFS family permease
MTVDPNEPPPGPSTRPSWGERIRSIALDLAPLRESRDFRLIYLGTSVSSIGSHITFVAVPFHVFSLTDSTLAVGLLGLCDLIPLLTLSIVGGLFADTMDKRRLLLITEAVAMVCSIGLALNAAAGEPQLWIIYTLATINAGAYAMGSPALRSATPRLVRKDLLPAAAALNHLYHNIGAIAGPIASGALIATVGLTTTFFIDVGTFVFALVCMRLMNPLPPAEDTERPTLRSVLDGVKFLKGKRVLQGSFIVDINAMMFGMPYALFPAVAANRFGGPEVLGLLYAAPSIGSLLVSVTSGWVGRVRRHGLIVYVSVIGWGAALVVFGMADALWLALVALAAAGAADSVSGIFRTAILQTATPAHMLGRLHGVELAVVASGPSLGDIEAGALAAVTSVQFSIVFGGLACIAGVGVMTLLMPQFARYDARNPTP